MLSQTIHTDIPTVFYHNAKSLRNKAIVLLLIFSVLVVYDGWMYQASKYTIGDFIQSLFPLLAILFGIDRLNHRYQFYKNKIPIITIEEDYIQHFSPFEFGKIQFRDIDSVELRNRFFGRHLKIHFNKKIDDDRSLIPSYNKWLSFGRRTKAKKKARWDISGLHLDPEEIVRTINYHLDQFKTKA